MQWVECETKQGSRKGNTSEYTESKGNGLSKQFQ